MNEEDTYSSHYGSRARYEKMNVLKVNDLQWYEIDDIDDLQYAENNIKID